MSERRFELRSDFEPTGDQPGAIEELTNGVLEGRTHQTLLGATGTGKTFTMANIIERTRKPTLIISHNKTLAAQLFEEMRELFPDNAVCYFVSYYDYYQPEAYIPQRDIYIEKDASRNADLDRLRLAATSNLLSREDVIVISSVSCLYGLGSPDAYANRVIHLQKGANLDRREFLLGLSEMQYQRNDYEPERGNFRVKGDCIEVYPAYEQYGVRLDLFGDEIESLQLFDPLTGELLAEEHNVYIFPAVHYVMPEEQKEQALDQIREELDQTVVSLKSQGKLLEAQRLLGRTRYDLEMIQEVGYCSGIENYARFFDGRERGSRAFCLLDYFRAMPERKRDDWLVMIDESHVTIPQIRGMFHGDQARKRTLVEHGFRLPSALDNRPITLDEFEEIVPRSIYVSATPAPYELEKSEGHVVEQVIRPTGLVDPPIEIKPARGQVPDLVEEARRRAERGERVLVTALTKKLCEDLAHYLEKEGLQVRYLHSEIDTLDRLDILADLRSGAFDVLVGVNLLREGLDLPEVSLVCILDADKQGFLRSQSSLIQTMGRAARNANSEAILYADTVTEQMQNAIDEVERRRTLQLAYNEEHGITPTTIQKAIRRGIDQELSAHRTANEAVGKREESKVEIDDRVKQLEERMLEAADQLDFELAAELRDRVEELLNPGSGPVEQVKTKAGTPGSRVGRTGRKRKGRSVE
ncbi:MAG: excinuclease ABC subunit UvrB [Planctomycetota bacterium]|nr:excinuclease ABC subunit UvrB [Planctomycetota bacterium]MEC8818389.1 excinuclease ABC subunit UvrB [Planctomycetota bacterium]MEC9158178.1 excinuclease ABC subunit UvrB [Planctomycetota bacterium]MEC9232983.1 excinuclease ABC subunit UvrB [Planctomycetota bacterium]MED5507122.1 excinuclease ABC subunit UvrB [Planctomycetota bacterium]